MSTPIKAVSTRSLPFVARMTGSLQVALLRITPIEKCFDVIHFLGPAGTDTGTYLTAPTIPIHDMQPELAGNLAEGWTDFGPKDGKST